MGIIDKKGYSLFSCWLAEEKRQKIIELPAGRIIAPNCQPADCLQKILFPPKPAQIYFFL
jgi:hypothetical protein